MVGVGGEARTRDPLLGKQMITLKLLNKLSVTKLAQLSNFSKSYISQVKHGKCPPSKRLLDSLGSHTPTKKQAKDYLSLFLESRKAMGVSDKTILFYKCTLYPFVTQVDYLKAIRQTIERYLNSVPPNHNGLATRHAYYRAMRTFYRWLDTEYGIKNPLNGLPAPILGTSILPALSQNEVLYLIESIISIRDKAIIALFTESGLRLSELVNIKPQDIDWDAHI